MNNPDLEGSVEEYLREAAGELVSFLERELPVVSGGGDWWESRVLGVLTTQQLDAVRRKNVTSLAGLDLSALVRVVRNNWRNLDRKLAFGQGAMNYVQELQTIRNLWQGHQSVDYRPTAGDVYRDLDTMERFLEVINAERAVVERVRQDRVRMASVVAGGGERAEGQVAEAEDVKETEDDPEEQERKSPVCPECGSGMVERVAGSGRFAGRAFWGCTEWSVSGCDGKVDIEPLERSPVGGGVSPKCPRCGANMYRRVARTGARAGQEFWGCSRYTEGCNGTLNMAAEVSAG